jgi:hypothetical protein
MVQQIYLQAPEELVAVAVVQEETLVVVTGQNPAELVA